MLTSLDLSSLLPSMQSTSICTPKSYSSAPALLQPLVPCKSCADGKVHPLSVTGKTIKELLGQGKALRDTPHPWPPPGHGATDQNPLAASIWPAPHGLTSKARPLHSRALGVMWHGVQSLTRALFCPLQQNCIKKL